MEYGLIGEKLGHSYSKEIHEQLADYTYDLTPLTKEEFTKFMEEKNFKAINVTIPYKQDVIPYLDFIDEHAKKIGAVNTIVNKNGRLEGHNTDFSGFLYMCKKNNVDMNGKKVIVLGNGGAAKAIYAVAEYMNAREIIRVNRREAEGVITYDECIKNHADADIIINTTPVGMYPNVDASPIDLTPFTNCSAVLDVIYNPLTTKLTGQANNLGIKGVTGLEMLVAQAKYAVEFFLDTSIDDEVIEPICEKIIKDKE